MVWIQRGSFTFLELAVPHKQQDRTLDLVALLQQMRPGVKQIQNATSIFISMAASSRGKVPAVFEVGTGVSELSYDN